MIDAELVKRLIASQFPEWKGLLVQPVARTGWDHRTFHLGTTMAVRLPSGEEYASQIEKEFYWLPKLAPFLPLAIPKPLALGKPGEGYPWNWSIYRWIEGESADSVSLPDFTDFALCLADFLRALHSIDSKGGPQPGAHNFYRGGSLKIYDEEARRALLSLRGKFDVQAAIRIWEKALSSFWHGPPVWVQGDVSAGNLLIKNGELTAVIDFGLLAVGDPACDLAIAWTLFQGKSREVFRNRLKLDDGTWERGRAWALWKALVVAAGFTNPNNAESLKCWQIIHTICEL
jgi:aminoglycoside phosphotransferase (APT) family kinase protein